MVQRFHRLSATTTEVRGPDDCDECTEQNVQYAWARVLVCHHPKQATAIGVHEGGQVRHTDHPLLSLESKKQCFPEDECRQGSTIVLYKVRRLHFPDCLGGKVDVAEL